MRLGFLSDIHEDIISLKKGLDVLHNQNCDQIICLGDITGFSNPYYPYAETKDANACIELVRAQCTIVVPGNHDLFSAGRVPGYNAGIDYPENWFSMEIGERLNLMKNKVWLYEHEVFPDLTTENIQYLQSLPEYQIAKVEDYNILFTHFLYPDVSGSLRKRIDDVYDYREHFRFMRQNNCILAFAGHMHREGFEVINMMGYREFGFRKKKLRMMETFIGLPSLASGRNKNGVAVFDTENFELHAVRLR